MSNPFVWYELITDDTAGAAAFYESVVGWTAQDSGQPGPTYTLFATKEGGVAGLLKAPVPSMSPVWVGYVSVDDVDDYANRFVAAGGAIHRAPDDIPTIGRFAMVADPQGAGLVLFKALPRADGAGPPSLDEPGYPGWRELMTTDSGAAYDFYADMFGWEKSGGHDMGPMGVYHLFAYDGADRGGIMTAPGAPRWGYYFRVDAIGAAVGRLKAAGGTVNNGPNQVPTGDWVVQATDVQGAKFALVSANA
jgi:predicted enzyme related to lactoylglutathione lyase